MNSTWYDDTVYSEFKGKHELKNNCTCDVLIVGGGLAGLSLLYNLKKNNVDAVLIEEKQIGSGASGRNGGFCLSGWAQDYEVLMKCLSKEEVVKLEQIAATGVQWMKKKCMSKGYEHTNLQPGVIKCFLSNNVEKVERDIFTQNQLFSQNEEFINKGKLNKYVCSDKYSCGVLRKDSFQFHPLNFMKALAQDCITLGASIFENCKFVNYQRNSGKIHASIAHNNRVFNMQSEKIVFATGGYGGKEINELKNYWLPIKTFIGVTKPMGDELQSVLKKPLGFSDNRRAGNYYRVLPGNRLSWGRGISAVANYSRSSLKKVISKEISYFFPELKNIEIDYVWSGNMAYASHYMPYVGATRIGHEDKNVFTIMGFGGHGMNTAPGAAMVLADFMLGKGNNYQVFNKFSRKWNGGLIGPYIAELKYKYLQMKDYFDFA